ncbi:MAG: hypothetical protein P0Y53_24315 [Candidatus Pseudobacter hemicellulosilyticus]|uniref:Uncharacterized protein n=1 Tax=Candidatus Pseudobacter hemicellulosilyticus TaxID=3121375 RepID=A0AAJ5WS05_9BACT|nr:MAG: hypothetical protein P0Y53_24315 [Pseudobacter sp.]
MKKEKKKKIFGKMGNRAGKSGRVQAAGKAGIWIAGVVRMK